MPVDYSRYPKNWKEISRRIRFERAANKCEWCGVENGAQGYRDPDGKFWTLEEVDHALAREKLDVSLGDDGWPMWRPVKIVLTVAHLGTPYADGTPGDKHNKMDVRDENLAALCQKCHLNYDRDEHMVNAARTRARKRQAAIMATGQLNLLEAV
jgi:hypothetical protein